MIKIIFFIFWSVLFTANTFADTTTCRQLFSEEFKRPEARQTESESAVTLLNRVRAEWSAIEALPSGSVRTAMQERFFSTWSQTHPLALRDLLREKFNKLIELKQANQSEYLNDLRHLGALEAPEVGLQLKRLARSGIPFEQVIQALNHGAIEVVLTSHPTQIQTATYRQIWQFYDSLSAAKREALSGHLDFAWLRARMAWTLGHQLAQKKILPWNESLEALRDPSRRAATLALWADRWMPVASEALQQVDAGAPRRQTVPEEAQEVVDLYFANIYWTLPHLRKIVLNDLQGAYGSAREFDRARAEKATERMLTLSTWAWDADGKSNVHAASMQDSNSIQQSGVYRLHAERLAGILETYRGMTGADASAELVGGLTALKTALSQHAVNLREAPQSLNILALRPEFDPGALVTSPSGRVREFFIRWAQSLRTSPIQEELKDLQFALRAFTVENQIRQNSEVNRKALLPVLEKLGLPMNAHSVQMVLTQPPLRAKIQDLVASAEDPVLRKELARLQVMNSDPGARGTYISADTKNLDDADASLLLLELSGLTGKVRYFPLIENMDTFRDLPRMVRAWLTPGSAMRRQILLRSAFSGEAPTLDVMFALSDTNRLGSQAANHYMEGQAEVVRQVVAQMSELYPVTPAELDTLKISRNTPGLASRRFSSEIFWGGGSQLARGGDWVTDAKAIHTDQGNARDLKYASPEMALLRLGRHLAHSLSAQSPERVGAQISAADMQKLQDLISAREALHRELFFEKEGYRDSMEAYLLFGSMLSESKSNSYGARPTSRADDNKAAGPVAPHRLADRLGPAQPGESFEKIIAKYGIDRVLKMTLAELWTHLFPGQKYSPPSIDQRAITTDNSLSETKINQLAMSVEAENQVGVDLATSARWMRSEDPVFLSYRRQKMAEVIASSLANLDSHISRLPLALRPLIDEDRRAGDFLRQNKGKTADQLTVEDLVATFAYIQHSVREVVMRNNQLSTLMSGQRSPGDDPLTRAQGFLSLPVMQRQTTFVQFGQSLLSWMHLGSTFGNGSQAPRGLPDLFPGTFIDPEKSGEKTDLQNDPLGQIEFLAWALHYEGQQLPVQVGELNQP